MRVETVNIDDVYPPEDEYGNLFISRDYSLKENQAYIDELVRDLEEKGRFEEPVVLVEDGGIWRIKAGNTRVMAMRKFGLESFQAAIDEDTDPRDLFELAQAAWRTDTSKHYELVEKSKIGQQLFLLCPDDEQIAKIMHEPVERVAKIRRGRSVAVELGGDEATQLTFAHFERMAEFEDDPDSAEQLLNASERELDQRYRQIVKDKEAAKNIAAICAELEAAGISFPEKLPDGFHYHAVLEDPEEDLYIDGIDPEDLVAFKNNYDVALYRRSDVYDSAAEDRRRRDERRAKMARIAESRITFFRENFRELKQLRKISVDRFDLSDSYLTIGVQDFIYEYLDFELKPDPDLCAIAEFCWTHDKLFDWHGEINYDDAETFIRLTDALTQDGYIPTGEETELYAEAQAFLEATNQDPED